MCLDIVCEIYSALKNFPNEMQKVVSSWSE